MRALALLPLLAAPALADPPTAPPMTAGEFEAFATGHTLEFLKSGALFGVEAYLPGRKVLLSEGPDGSCLAGDWYDHDGLICFAYDAVPGEHCWTLWRDGDQLLTLPSFALPDDVPRVVRRAETPLACAAPDVGV